MSEVVIKKIDNGPLLVKGDISLVDMDGNAFDVKDSVYLCRCGLTSNAPFCNGAHKLNEFRENSKAVK